VDLDHVNAGQCVYEETGSRIGDIPKDQPKSMKGVQTVEAFHLQLPDSIGWLIHKSNVYIDVVRH